MANICSNRLYCSTDNDRNMEKIMYYLDGVFGLSELNGEVNWMQSAFESRWTFPEREFEALMAELEHDPTLFIEIVSFEPGMGYLEAHIFQNGMRNTIP